MTDFLTAIVDTVKGLPIIDITIMAILFILVYSDIFIDQILTRFNGAVQEGVVTNRGAMISCIIFVLLFITIHLLIKADIV